MPRERTRSRSSAVPNSASAEESSSEDVLPAPAPTLATASEAFDGSLLEVSTGSPQSAVAATIPLALTDNGASSVGTAGERWRSE